MSKIAMHRFWVEASAIALLALPACGGSSNSTTNVRLVDPDGVECATEDGSTFTCTIDPDVVTENDLTSTDLADYVSALAADGVTENSTLLIQAYGGGSVNPQGGGKSDEATLVSGGVAQTVTTVADFQAAFGTTQLYLYVGLEGNQTTAESKPIAGGGAATIVSTVDGSTEGSDFDVSTNVVLIAGGGGAGGSGNYDYDNQGVGGAGGVAISSAPGDGNCAIASSDTGAVCGSGSDGTTGSQHGHSADTKGDGGGGGVAGSGYHDGTSGIGGEGGEPSGGSKAGWAGGYSPAFAVSAEQGQGGSGHQEKGDNCAGTEIDMTGWGGGGGGGYGGGGGGGAQETCPASDSDFVTLGAGGGGGGSFAIVSTVSYSGSSPSATSGDGQVVLIFIADD